MAFPQAVVVGSSIVCALVAIRAYIKYHHRLSFLWQGHGLREVLDALKKKIYSRYDSYCLRRDITLPFAAPSAKIPVTIRKIRESDIPILFDATRPGLSDVERKEIYDRQMLWREKVQTCYVGVDQRDTPCYVQWLIGPNENAKLQKIFKGGFPVLRNDEALLEDAYTPEAFRGLGIMSSAMAQIAEQGKQIGARYVITFVHEDNIPSLKGCKRSGFVPYKMRRETNFLFLRRFTFTPLPEGTPYPFDVEPKP
jgi:GNAT superfamily N-acetyltransferase